MGRAVARDLAVRVNVLSENCPVGRMAGFGLSHADLRGDSPALVYMSNTGFGQFSPDARKVGYDTVSQAIGGLMSLTGEKDGGPVKAGLPFADTPE